jgi:hypothetical protein
VVQSQLTDCIIINLRLNEFVVVALTKTVKSKTLAQQCPATFQTGCNSLVENIFERDRPARTLSVVVNHTRTLIVRHYEE